MATMTLVESVGAFLEAIEKSGLTTPETTERIRELGRNVEDPMSLARRLVKEGTFTKWQAGQLLYGFHQLVVGKYKLLEQLGAGEMGRVFLAEHVQMGRRHSLKMFSRRFTSQPEVLKKFLAEAQRVSGLEHRHISHVYDVNQDGDRYYLVMEYVEGQSLQALVEKSGKLTPTVALEYVRQTAEGLSHAHENQVTHGDLKPSNLMLDGSGTVKILDLGQARLFESPAAAVGGDDEEEGVPVAAIHHAPEQRGGARTVDHASDIYSLGSVLSFLLTGQTAENAATAEKQLAAVAGLPADVRALVTALMAGKSVDRPASMADVIERIAVAQNVLLGAAAPGKPPLPKAAKEKDAAKPAEAPAQKAKRPPVAKAINDSASMPVAKARSETPAPAAEDKAAEGEPAPADDAFGGFAIKTKGRVGKKPPVKAAAAAPAAVLAAEGAEAGEAAPVPAADSKLSLIIGGAVGGSALALAAIGVLVFFLFFRGKPAEVAKADQTQKSAAPATATPSEDTGEANPLEANPAESNPAALVEDSNPAPDAVAPNAVTPVPATPAATDKPPDPMTPPVTTVAATEPMPPAATPAPTPAPTPAVEPTPAAVAVPTPAPAPAAAPPANPFVGFAKTVSLPKLPTGASELPPDVLAPVVLGPCVVDDKALVIARLKGGEFAAKGGRQKFDMQAANGGTALRDWDISLSGGEAPAVIAKLSATGGNLSFQWTPEAGKHTNAPFLMNCALELSAGSGRHIAALRPVESGPPLTLDFDKATSSQKWILENTPDPKLVHVQITAIDGVPRKKFDPVDVIEGSGEDIIVWTGPADDAMVLGMKLTSVVGARNVNVTMAPQMKFEWMKRPEKFNKKTLAGGKTSVNQRLNFLTNQLKTLGNGKDAALEQQRSLINQEIETITKGGSQVDAVLEFMEAVKGQVKLQCRVFYVAEDTQVDLLVTSNDAPVADAK